MKNEVTHIFTSDSVAEGLPDKVAENISEAILGAVFEHRVFEGIERRHRITACPFCGGNFHDETIETAGCDDCGQMVRINLGRRTRIYVKEDSVAAYIAKTIGNGHYTHAGDHYHFDEVRGRSLFYVTSPTETFYSMHRGEDMAIIVGRQDCVVPDNCKAHIVPLSELFSINCETGDIRTSRNSLHRLLPKVKETRRPLAPRMIHERRDQWLQFIMHLFSKALDKSNFWRGRIRPQVVCDWFTDNFTDAPQNVKTYQRDLNQFLHLDKKNIDKREAFIVLLLRTAQDPTRTMGERLGIAKMIPPLIEYLAKTTKQMNGRPVEITRAAWQYCKDGTREYIPVVDIEKFFDDLDKRISEDKQVSEVA